MTDKIYLNVPYVQKDDAKKLGARWDSTIKKWYFEGDTKYYYKFAKWIPDADLFVHNEIFIIKGRRKCYNCHNSTTIVGIGISDHSLIYRDDEKYFVKSISDSNEDSIHLAWFDSEKNIPPYLLNYLKHYYNTRTVFSKTQNEYCFSNCCEHCNAIQGNYFLFEESSPLSTDCEGQRLINRMGKLDIYTIDIDYALPLKIDMTYCDNDWAYTNYSHFHYSKDDYVSYLDMYSDNSFTPKIYNQ